MQSIVLRSRTSDVASLHHAMIPSTQLCWSAPSAMNQERIVSDPTREVHETECSLCGSHVETMRPRFETIKPVVKIDLFFFRGVGSALQHSAVVARAGITNPSTSREEMPDGDLSNLF